MFKGAKNVLIQGGTFIVSTTDPLLKEVAPNAILNAGGRVDEVRCYPGTREEVIDKMDNWMDSEGVRTSRMMWLSGPAGAGKSAIIQTVAVRCQERGRQAANFFFFSGDKTRNHAQPLVATLVYQLRALYPALNELIEDCLTATPLICKASIGEQFKKLISSPIINVRNSSSIHQPIVLIIDGLDECADKTRQDQILLALHALIENDDSPFLVLVASRAESHIVMSFNKIAASVVSIFLDDEYRPQNDIRRFVIAKFNEIKGAHRLAHTLDECWPSQADVNAIIHKSSGQFIYAATVMRFIEYSTASPSLSMLAVHGTRPAANHSPYAQLDTVYSYILSNSHDIQSVIFCLGVHFAATIPNKGWNMEGQDFGTLLNYTGYKQSEIESLFADLAAIIGVHTYPPLRLAFYHASLSDYLMDKSRSGIYYVDVHRIATEVLTMCLGRMLDSSSWVIGVSILARVKEATPALSQCLLEASKGKLDRSKWHKSTNVAWKFLIGSVYRLYFASDPALYRRILRNWIHFAYINNINTGQPANLNLLMNMRHDIYKYYNWYLLTEGLKYTLGLRKLQNTN
ncbi:hypothetical protein D9619_007695 [Psilocybe cf. subviscida]|uniref:NACHT domain-containing protein n=1 Tax=Psilocybe cf. subviscida TaxID=2480587 RepID=A0A8H5ES91_9AGAR|nr:hypothetical protein D9619_007695 [Psilocybe cf. subviscida]